MSASPFASILPPAMTPLVGRESELFQITEAVTREHVRLLTLSGPGGVGKTRLAISALEALRPAFEGRAAFVSVAALSDAALVPGEITRAIDAPLGSGLTAVESIIRRLGPDPTLLVIDNLEQVIGCSSFLVSLLLHLPRLQLIVTSRELLRVRAEHVLTIDPFPVMTERGEAELSPAGRLFVARAKAENATFSPGAADIPAINQICAQLDGLPLAIELAAARMRTLSSGALKSRLAEPLELLIRGPRDLPERQRTMRDAIAWSFELLTAAERDLFTLLAIFPGSASLTSLEAIWPAWSEGGDSADVLDLLESLIAKSLVAPVHSTGNDARFDMLMTLREFGREHLKSDGQLERGRRQHGIHFLGLCEASIPELSGAARSMWLDRLQLEIGNLRTGMEWSLTKPESDLPLRFIEALWRFWESKGHMEEGEAFTLRALAISNTDADLKLKAAAIYGATVMPYRLGHYEVAREQAGIGLALAREIGDDTAIVRALNGSALVAFELGDFEQAERDHLEGLALAERLGNAQRITTACVNLAIHYYEAGRNDEARALYQRALDIHSGLDGAYDRAFALNGLGIVSHRQGDLEAAQTYLQSAIEIRKTDRDSGAYAASLINLGMVEIDAGDLMRAIELLREGLRLRWDRGELRGCNEALSGLARIACRSGQLVEAARIIGAIDALIDRGQRLPRPVAHDLEETRRASELALKRTAYQEEVAIGRERPLHHQIESALALALEDTPAVQTPSKHDLLTPREIDVLRLIAEGKSDRQIGEILAISRNTVIRHVANIFLKLEINSRTLAAVYAFNHGIATAPTKS